MQHEPEESGEQRVARKYFERTGRSLFADIIHDGLLCGAALAAWVVFAGLLCALFQ